jgi:hypothetical protein
VQRAVEPSVGDGIRVPEAREHCFQWHLKPLGNAMKPEIVPTPVLFCHSNGRIQDAVAKRGRANVEFHHGVLRRLRIQRCLARAKSRTGADAVARLASLMRDCVADMVTEGAWPNAKALAQS